MANLMPLKSPWVMFAETSQDGQKQCATGGLDNVCSIWKLPDGQEPAKMMHALEGHQGYVCGARFVGPGQLVTTSGDGTAALWDLNALPDAKDVPPTARVFLFRGRGVAAADASRTSRAAAARPAPC